MINIRRPVFKHLIFEFKDDDEVERGEFKAHMPEIREDSLEKVKLKYNYEETDKNSYWTYNDDKCHVGEYTNSSKVIVNKED